MFASRFLLNMSQAARPRILIVERLVRSLRPACLVETTRPGRVVLVSKVRQGDVLQPRSLGHLLSAVLVLLPAQLHQHLLTVASNHLNKRNCS